MKKIYLCVWLLSCTFFCLAQTKVLFSPDYKLSKNKLLQGHLHSDASGHYMYFVESSSPPLIGGYVAPKVTYILEKYDKKFKQVFSKEYISSKKGIRSSGMHYFKDKFAWLTFEKDKKAKTMQYYITPIDMKGKAAPAKKIAKFKYDNNTSIPSTWWGVSQDTSSILFTGRYDTNEKDENFQVYFSVLDNDFEKKWSKKIRLPYSQRRVVMLSSDVSNDGTVYFVAKVYEDNKTKENKKKGKGRKKVPAYDIYMYTMNGDMEKPKKYEIKLGDSFAKGVKLRLDEDNNLSCVGFYGDSKSGPVKGVFYLQLSKETGEVEFTNKRKFTPKELLAFGDNNVSKDKKSKDSGLDATFYFRDISILENGDLYATAEEAYSYTTSYTDSRGVTTFRTVYVRNAIISIQIDKEGVVKNVGIIPKRQSGSVTDFFSYAMLEGKEKVYYLYNEDDDNLRRNITDPDKIKAINSAKDCVAVLTTLEDDNKLNRKELFSRDDSKSLLLPTKSKQISDTELFFFATKYRILGKSDFKFGIIALD